MQPYRSSRANLGRSLGVSLCAGGWIAAALIASAPAAAEPAPSSARPGKRPCTQERTLRSQHSKEPTKITFVNASGMYRALHWIDFKGQTKDYGGLNAGEKKTFDTFRTHPWVITTGPGDCIEIFLPSAEPGTAVLK